MIGNFPAIFNFNRLFLNLNRFISVPNYQFSPLIAQESATTMIGENRQFIYRWTGWGWERNN